MLTLDVPAVEDLDVDILVGTLFVTTNDTAFHHTKHKIIIAGSDTFSCRFSQTSQTYWAVRACHLLCPWCEHHCLARKVSKRWSPSCPGYGDSSVFLIPHPYFRIISLRTRVDVHIQNARDFPQVKLDSEIYACFLLNKHGDPHFFIHGFKLHKVIYNISQFEEKFKILL